jgi:glycosyltransferase involved in cell wall biosynthesis
MSAPAFSVVVAAFNEEDMVADAIRSVQKQTRSDWELVLIDDGSEDDTARVAGELAADDPRIRVISQPNAGLSAARNAGIAAGRAELVAFLDADDLWLPTYLEVAANVLEAEPAAGWAYTDAWALDTEKGRFRRATAMSTCQPPDVLPTDPAEVMKLLIRQNFMWVSATVRRRALTDAGGFSEDMKSAEDIELWFRILAKGWKVVRMPGVLGIKRERPDAMSRAEVKNMRNLQKVMGMVAGNPEVPADVRAMAGERIAYYEQWEGALGGTSRPLALALAARRLAGSIGKAVLGRYVWRRNPPDEVQQAFPDLS